MDLVLLWYRRIDERRTLASLSTRELRDFGANRSEAMEEYQKPFWRA